METASVYEELAAGSPQSVYAYVSGQIAALLPQLGLRSSCQQIRQVYQAICKDSLSYPLGTRPVAYSRINHDGSPFQYAITLGTPVRSLQFLADVGPMGLPGAVRNLNSRGCITTVAENLHAEVSLAAVADLLDRMAPAEDADLLADPAGAYWVGAGFSPTGAAALKIYINGSWGEERDRWTRLRAFASHFGADNHWQKIEDRVAADLKPLGSAITLGADRPSSGRIYLSTYGKQMGYYEDLARSICGESFCQELTHFARCMLGKEYPYPTQTAVCSFGFSARPALDFKFELCAHCLFANDVEAASRLRSWFEFANVDAAAYRDMLTILSEGYLSESTPELHCYIGIGQKRNKTGYSVYMKPRLTR